MLKVASVQKHQRCNLQSSLLDQSSLRKPRKNIRNVLSLDNEKDTRIIYKTHSLDVQIVQLLIGRLLHRSSLVLKLVSSDVGSSIVRPGRVQVGR